MINVFMTHRRRLNAFAQNVLAGLCVSALLCQTATAANATRVRAHRVAIQSAGAAQAHGKVQIEQAGAEGAPRRGSRHAHAVADEKKSDGKADNSAKGPRGAKKSERAQAPVKHGRGHSQRQIRVEAPLPMSQASSLDRGRSVREEIAAKRAAAATAVASPASGTRKRTPGPAAVAEQAAAATPLNDSSRPVTVDDFLRAANGGMLPGEVKSDVASSAAKPANDGRGDATDANRSLPPSAKEATGAFAKKSGASASGKSTAASPAAAIADASPSRDLPAQRVVSGFGGEVDVLPGPAPARGGLSTKNAPPDELAMHDRALQQQLAEDAMTPVTVPLYSRSGRLLMPAPLKGSHEILVHQNAMADQEGLARIQDDNDLNQMRAAHLLLPLPESDALLVNDELPMNRRCARPWTVKFVGDIARAFYAKFHEPLRLSSAVRTVEFQRKLQRVNGNAAAIDGDTASPHLTGQAIDFGKSGMSGVEIAWMRAYLMPLIGAGKIDVEEEFQQSCFHISVYANYVPKKPMRRDVAMRQ